MVTWSYLQYNLIHVIKFCWWRNRKKLWRHDFYFKITFILRRPTVANFVDIIKNSTMFMKTIFEDSKTVKKSRTYAWKCNLYLFFLILKKLLIFGEKSWCQENSKGTSRGLCIFWIFFRWGTTLPSFINVGYVSQILEGRGGGLFRKFKKPNPE